MGLLALLALLSVPGWDGGGGGGSGLVAAQALPPPAGPPGVNCSVLGQAQALNSFYVHARGDSWARTDGWLARPNCTDALTGAPVPYYCCYYGVKCCDTSGKAAGLCGTLNAGGRAGRGGGRAGTGWWRVHVVVHGVA